VYCAHQRYTNHFPFLIDSAHARVLQRVTIRPLPIRADPYPSAVKKDSLLSGSLRRFPPSYVVAYERCVLSRGCCGAHAKACTPTLSQPVHSASFRAFAPWRGATFDLPSLSFSVFRAFSRAVCSLASSRRYLRRTNAFAIRPSSIHPSSILILHPPPATARWSRPQRSCPGGSRPIRRIACYCRRDRGGWRRC
jgi:hypothetical protein